MNSAMKDKIDLAANKLEAMSSEDEDGGFPFALENDADDGLVDEDDDWGVVPCDVIWELCYLFKLLLIAYNYLLSPQLNTRMSCKISIDQG